MFTRRDFGLSSSSLVVATLLPAAAPLPTEFQQFKISVGDNGPDLDFNADRLTDILVALHLRTELGRIASELGVTRPVLNARIARLRAAALVQGSADKPTPTCLVATIEDQRRYLRADAAVIEMAVSTIIDALSEIQAIYATLPGFASVPFAQASLLILSNVALDNWQIETVERAFLQFPRPLRGGGCYYLAFFEWPTASKLDALGIYGNHSAGPINVYGNRRYRGAPNMANATPAMFGLPPTTRAHVMNVLLSNDLSKRWRDTEAPIDPAREAGLRELNLIGPDGRVAIPMMSAEDEVGLRRIAGLIAPRLLAVLEAHRKHLRVQFAASTWASDGVTFEEFAIWWYHVFYTAVTDRLIKRGAIRIPQSGVTTYVELSDAP